MTEQMQVAVLGAGFGGLAAAHALAQVGIDDVVIFERSTGVGGVWRANTYPGAACDVPSHLYSLSYAPNPYWSRTYATQPEILAYVEDCYARFDLRRKVRTATEIVSATWQDEGRCWRLRDGNGVEYEAGVFLCAMGMIHTPAFPAIAGMEDFAGTAFHSGHWNHDHDLSGRRVAVIGTGATSVQIVPAIADAAERVVVFQRTPAWIVPRRDEPFTEAQKAQFAAEPEVARRLRDELHVLFESNLSFLRGDPSGTALARVCTEYLDHKVVDPALRAKLRPGYPVGCKRTLISSAFYAALQRDDVELVTEAIERVTADGIRTVDGVERDCDTIVWSTGFRATEYLRGVEVTGIGGQDLHQKWDGVPRAYHGMAVPGFPNFFMLYGPNTNQGGNSIILMLEAQAGFIADALATMEASGATEVEVTEEAMDRYTTELLTNLDKTVWTDGCDSYFRTAGGDVVTQIPHTSSWYRDRLSHFPAKDFHLAVGSASVPRSSP
ncbi:MAG: NAD(P)/FAD-dependent oxidoreductase [Actinomycetota bacterium]|nr:NAD(P)/FAD-dependent oxidoreductase [Actinomycetota bacterium]